VFNSVHGAVCLLQTNAGRHVKQNTPVKFRQAELPDAYTHVRAQRNTQLPNEWRTDFTDLLALTALFCYFLSPPYYLRTDYFYTLNFLDITSKCRIVALFNKQYRVVVSRNRIPHSQLHGHIICRHQTVDSF
jgi:hypothetical protein